MMMMGGRRYEVLYCSVKCKSNKKNRMKREERRREQYIKQTIAQQQEVTN